MIACQKDYTITVSSSAPTVDAYWSMDHPGPIVFGNFTQLDEVHGLQLKSSFFDFTGPPYEVIPQAGGLYGDGLAFKTINGPFNSGFGITDNVLSASAVGWSVVFWFKVNFWASPLSYGVGTSVDFTTGDNALFEVGFNNPNAFPVGAPTPPNVVSFFVNDAVSTDTIAPGPFAPTLGQWHMLHIFFDQVAGSFGYSVDNGPRISTPGLVCGVTPGGDFQMYQTWSDTSADVVQMMIDEVLFKMSRILTPAEVTYLWRGGLGHTWPLT